jgi:hypothetical protein
MGAFGGIGCAGIVGLRLQLTKAEAGSKTLLEDGRMNYIIQEQGNGCIKIGFTERLLGDRLRELQCANPYELLLIAVIPGGTKQFEKTLHDLCAEFSCPGGSEWFTKEALGILQQCKFFNQISKPESLAVFSQPNLSLAAQRLCDDFNQRSDRLAAKMEHSIEFGLKQIAAVRQISGSRVKRRHTKKIRQHGLKKIRLALMRLPHVQLDDCKEEMRKFTPRSF